MFPHRQPGFAVHADKRWQTAPLLRVHVYLTLPIWGSFEYCLLLYWYESCSVAATQFSSPLASPLVSLAASLAANTTTLLDHGGSGEMGLRLTRFTPSRTPPSCPFIAVSKHCYSITFGRREWFLLRRLYDGSESAYIISQAQMS